MENLVISPLTLNAISEVKGSLMLPIQIASSLVLVLDLGDMESRVKGVQGFFRFTSNLFPTIIRSSSVPRSMV